MEQDNGLLEKLQAVVGCAYISDLPRAFRMGKRLRGIPPDWWRDDGHTPEEWTDALRYITNCERSFSTVEEAVRYLIKFTEGE